MRPSPTSAARLHALGTGPRLVVHHRDPDGEVRTVSPATAVDVPFEDCPPVRTIPHRVGQHHTPGHYWSATTGTLVGYESHLESRWMTLLDFDPDVTVFVGQPLTFDGVDTDGPWTHTPDLLARRVDGSTLLLDVKNRRKAGHLDVRRQHDRTRAACDLIGWEYAMVTEPPRQLWATLSWLAGFRRPPQAGHEYIPRLLAVARRPAAIAEICSFFDTPEIARPVLFHLCWQQRLVFDLTKPLRDTTLVRTREDGPAHHVLSAHTPPGEPR